MDTAESIYNTLVPIYNTHRRQHKENRCDSQQMCLMWSTNDPPEEICCSEPMEDIEATFGIEVDDDDALDLYDTTLREAAQKIKKMQKDQQNRKVKDDKRCHPKKTKNQNNMKIRRGVACAEKRQN